MTTKADIGTFLSYKKLALLRWSSTAPVIGGRLDDELKPKGFEISLAYLQEGDAGPRLASLSGKVDGLIIATPKAHCLLAAKEAIAANMPRVWIQNGCQSPEGLALLEEKGVPVVCKECVMMYAEPVKSVHSFHRWLWGKLGKLAK
jgi:predicted CoA-binding protein